MHPRSATNLSIVFALRRSPSALRFPHAGFCLALAAGVFTALAIPGIGHGALAWAVLVPLLWISERTPSLKRVLLLGWCSGIAVNLLGFIWVVDLLQRFAPMGLVWAALAHLGFSTYQGFSWGISLWAGELVSRRAPSLPRWVAVSLSFAVCEWAYPLVLPWTLGITQVDNRPILQLAEVAGAHGLTALVVAVNAALAAPLGGDQKRRLWWFPLVFAAAVALWGVSRMNEIEAADAAAPKVKIGAVKSDLPAGVLLDPRAHLASLRSTSEKLAESGAELIVWSETTYPYSLPDAWSKDFAVGQAARVRGNFTVPVLFGAATQARDASQGLNNSAYLLNSEGYVEGRYDKRALVPFGEKVPFDDVFPSLREFRMKAAGSYSAGAAHSIFSTQVGGSALRIAPLICFDDLFARIASDHVGQGAHALVSLSNDAWFGESAEPEQHLASAILRSVETRRPMVRVVNAGPSALVTASGEVAAGESTTPSANHRVEGVMFEVPVVEREQTWYARYGRHTDALWAALWVMWLFASKLTSKVTFCAPERLDAAIQTR